jgi:hypothetical protein
LAVGLDLALVALLVMFYVQNASDIVSTWLGIRVFGLHEANPVAKWIFGTWGIRLGGLILKIPYLVIATALVVFEGDSMYWPLLIYDTAFVFVIFSNLLQSADSAGFLKPPATPPPPQGTAATSQDQERR